MEEGTRWLLERGFVPTNRPGVFRRGRETTFLFRTRKGRGPWVITGLPTWELDGDDRVMFSGGMAYLPEGGCVDTPDGPEMQF